MKTLREYIEILDEISRRDFLKGVGATAGLAATGGVKAVTDAEKARAEEMARKVARLKAMAAAEATPDDIKQRQIIVTYFKLIRDVVNPLVKFDKNQLTDTLSADIFLTYNPQNGSILDIKSSDNSPWSQAILSAFSQAFPNKQLPKGWELLGGGDRTSYRMTFRFTPKQVFGLNEEVDETASPDAVKRIEQLVQYK